MGRMGRWREQGAAAVGQWVVMDGVLDPKRDAPMEFSLSMGDSELSAIDCEDEPDKKRQALDMSKENILFAEL